MSINGSTNANGDVAAGIDPLELGVWDPLVEPLAIMLLHIVAPSNQNPQWKEICDDCKDRYREIAAALIYWIAPLIATELLHFARKAGATSNDTGS